MQVDIEKKRLKAIKLKYVFFPTKCDSCGKEYKREKMWRVNRYGILQNLIVSWHYCQNCMHSAIEVLNEIDTDESPHGIAFVDNPLFFVKKDYTRINNAMDRAFEKKS